MTAYDRNARKSVKKGGIKMAEGKKAFYGSMTITNTETGKSIKYESAPREVSNQGGRLVIERINGATTIPAANESVTFS